MEPHGQARGTTPNAPSGRTSRTRGPIHPRVNPWSSWCWDRSTWSASPVSMSSDSLRQGAHETGRSEKATGQFWKRGGTSLEESNEKCRRDCLTKCDPCNKFLVRHINQPVLIEPAFCARERWTFEPGPWRPGSFAVSRAADTEVEGGEDDLRLAGYDTQPSRLNL